MAVSLTCQSCGLACPQRLNLPLPTVVVPLGRLLEGVGLDVLFVRFYHEGGVGNYCCFWPLVSILLMSWQSCLVLHVVLN